jgi:pimeloyl-ACP methyl ester carboxylesterase/DNA-binding CsgD family transcriptional regulator/PAS domain-containing protein
METSLRGSAVESQLRVVDALYGAVLEPDQYTAVISAVDEIFRASAANEAAPIGSQLAGLKAHVSSAARLFAMARPQWRRRLEDLLEAKSFAAMAVSDAGRVVMMNRAAVQMLGRPESVADLPLRADAHAEVGRFLGLVARSGTAAPAVVVGWHPSDDRALLFVLEVVDGEWQAFDDLGAQRPSVGPIILVKSTETRLTPHVWRLAHAAFGLTPAEQDVVRELAGGASLREIAVRRSRSLNTLKTQLQAALTKTGTRSQGQLLCMVTALAHLAEATPELTQQIGPLCAPRRGTVALKSATLSDQLVLKYVEMGAKGGRPVLLLAPTNRPDFTDEIVDAFHDRKLRVICPVRPGNWGTARWPDCSPQNTARHYVALLNDLSLDRVVLAGLRTGGAYAIELARQAPDRFCGLVLVDTGAPLDSMSKFAAMPPWPRSLYTTGRILPDLLILPFRYCASDFRAGAGGERRAVETFYRDSPIDLELVKTAKYYEIARRNLTYILENPDQLAREIGFWVRDCSRDLMQVSARMPVRFLHGDRNSSFPAADVAAFCRQTPGATARIQDGAAMLMIYVWPQLLAEELDLAATQDRRGAATARGALSSIG